MSHATKNMADVDASVAAMIAESPAKAVDRFRHMLSDDPLDPVHYRALAKALAAQGNDARSDAASVEQRLNRAIVALQREDLETAELIARDCILSDPTDAGAIRVMADVARQAGYVDGAERLLRFAIELRPDRADTKVDLARLFRYQNRNQEALDLIDEISTAGAADDGVLYLKAMVLGQAARHDEAVAVFQHLVERSPSAGRLWASYGRALKTVGRTEEGIAAFRRAIEAEPNLGEAWWSLSDLKTVRLDKADIAQMEQVLRAPRLPEKDACYVHFALGKAYEDQRSYKPSFTHYETANRLRRKTLDYEPERFTRFVADTKQLFTRDYFDARKGTGHPSRDPIFILGMTRAGSTLIEQILSSHSQVEGTMELPEVMALAGQLSDDFNERVAAVANLPSDRFAELGQAYIDNTRSYRMTAKPMFVDKMPNNWLYIPLIHLMLPNARIVDARRHPLACCFSNFKQNFGKGQDFSYDLADLGDYYRNYVEMLAHIDDVLPGRVHRVFHEEMVDDPETTVRNLLDYVGLPFEEGCLRFHENARAVRTASAAQVRRPINRDGVDLWRSYEPWLGPLKRALGEVLTRYPEVPAFR